jgi:hypothetical protein
MLKMLTVQKMESTACRILRTTGGAAMKQESRTPIPNIDIGKVYDSRYGESDINVEAFGKLAEFFGRNMPVHRHDRFFQLHYLASGQIACIWKISTMWRRHRCFSLPRPRCRMLSLPRPMPKAMC